MKLVLLGVFSISIFATVLSAGELREWTSVTGKTVEAEFVGKEGSRVVLKKSDGKIIKIAFSALRPADQQYIAKLSQIKSPINRNKAVPTHLKKLLGNSMLSPEGKKVSLEKYVGKMLVFYEFANYCHEYLQFTPKLVEIGKEWKALGLPIEIVMLNIPDDETEMKKDIKEMGVPWDYLLFGSEEGDNIYGFIGGCQDILVVDEEGRAITVKGETELREHGAQAYDLWRDRPTAPLNWDLLK